MGALASDFFRTISVRRTHNRFGERCSYLTRERVFSDDASQEVIERLCRDPKPIIRASAFAQTLNGETDALLASQKGRKPSSEPAIYVIEAIEYGLTKIGISKVPTDRFESLQQSHWSDLSLFAVAWSPARAAGRVEHAALALAAQRGVRLNGEWVRLSGSQALSLLIEASRSERIGICDSATWMRNWNDRMSALRLAKSAYRLSA